MPSPGSMPDMKCAESWNCAVSEASTMSDSSGISQCRQAGPLMAAITGTSMFSRFISSAPAFPMHAVIGLGGDALGQRACPGRGAEAGEFLARAGQDHHAVVAVAPHLGEGVGQLAVRHQAPAQRAVVGVQAHLQDAVLPPHAEARVLLA